MKMKRSKSLTLECLQNWMMSCILWPLGFNRWYSLHSFQLTLRVLSLSMLTILKGKVFLKYINKNYTLQLDLLGESSLEEDFFKWHTTVMMNFKRVQMSLTASVNKTTIAYYTIGSSLWNKVLRPLDQLQAITGCYLRHVPPTTGMHLWSFKKVGVIFVFHQFEKV